MSRQEHKQRNALWRLVRKYGLTQTQAGMAAILFYHAPGGFCSAARFVRHCRNGHDRAKAWALGPTGILCDGR